MERSSVLSIEDLDVLITELRRRPNTTREPGDRGLDEAMEKLLALRAGLRARVVGNSLDVGVTGGLLARIEVSAVGDHAELVVAKRRGETVKTVGHVIHRDVVLDKLCLDAEAAGPIGPVLAEAIDAVARSLQDWARA